MGYLNQIVELSFHPSIHPIQSNPINQSHPSAATSGGVYLQKSLLFCLTKDFKSLTVTCSTPSTYWFFQRDISQIERLTIKYNTKIILCDHGGLEQQGRFHEVAHLKKNISGVKKDAIYFEYLGIIEEVECQMKGIKKKKKSLSTENGIWITHKAGRYSVTATLMPMSYCFMAHRLHHLSNPWTDNP